MAESWPPKRPGEKLTYQANFATLLGDDTIAGDVSWAATPDGELSIGNQSDSDTASTIDVDGGEDGTVYLLVASFTGASGQDYEQEIYLRVEANRGA